MYLTGRAFRSNLGDRSHAPTILVDCRDSTPSGDRRCRKWRPSGRCRPLPRLEDAQRRPTQARSPRRRELGDARIICCRLGRMPGDVSVGPRGRHPKINRAPKSPQTRPHSCAPGHIEDDLSCPAKEELLESVESTRTQRINDAAKRDFQKEPFRAWHGDKLKVIGKIRTQYEMR